jgi:zinc D-Ala-D-Ala dipeptidase
MLARSITAAVLAVTCGAAADAVGQQPTTLPPQASVPATFADITSVAPAVVVEMRYFGDDNFVGRPIDGYDAPVCLLTRQAADALAAAQARLAHFGLGLKVFDCYRPARAVAHFVRWANDPADLLRKADYYPEIDKARLFELGYIAERSGHSRGSTVDLTLVDLATGTELDMGTGWDLFSPSSWPLDPSMTPAQRAHRMLLQSVLVEQGFRPYDKEWWHFTLRNEPFPETYFDFPVRAP